jgi:multisubunit Na+/H+ antiporter MnhB subunit
MRNHVMNRNTRIFLFGVVLLGVGILLLQSYPEPEEDPILAVAGLVVGALGLALSAGGAFLNDP